MKTLFMITTLGAAAVALGSFMLWPAGMDNRRAERIKPPALLVTAEPRAWEQRIRAYNRAKARIELNERLNPEERRQAIWQLQIDYFAPQDLARLWQYERQRDGQR